MRAPPRRCARAPPRGILPGMLFLLLACDGPDAPKDEPAAPDAGTVALSPAAPDTDDVITVVVTGSSGALSYAWTVDGAPAGTDAPTLDGSAFAKGQVVAVE